MSTTAAFAPRARVKADARAAAPSAAAPGQKRERISPGAAYTRTATAVPGAAIPPDPARIPVHPPAPVSGRQPHTAQDTAERQQAAPAEGQRSQAETANTEAQQQRETPRTLARLSVPQSPHQRLNPAYEAARNGGLPLDDPERTYFEQRYGYNFEHVRVHADGRSAEAARSVGARAYTLGSHIVFDAGEYAPSTASGRQLLGHELAHVVQQSRGGGAPAPFPGTSLETAARQAALWSTPGVVRVAGASAPGIAREPRSLTQNVNPAALNDKELEQETMQVNIWLSQHGNVSDPNSEHMVTALNRLEAEVRKRHAQQAAPRRPILPTVKGTGAQDLLGAMQTVDAVQPSDKASGLYTLEFQGEEKTLTQKEYDELRRRARNILKDHIARVSSKNAGTRAGYASQKTTDRDHWLVAPIVKFLGNVQDPGPYLDSAIADADIFVAQAEAALQDGHYTAAAEAMSKGEIRALSAERMWQAYFQGIIGAGEMTITVLEITRDAAFISLAILATIATGGAAAGAMGAAETTAATTTVFGVELAAGTGTVANAIAVGAPIVASLGEAAAKIAMGDPVDWGELVLNTALSIFLARFGGKATEGIAKPIVSRLATGVEKRAAKIIIEKVIHSTIMHAGSTALTTTLNALYQKLRGRKMTWGQFMDQLVAALTDPKGLAVVAVTTALTAHAQIKLTGEPGGGGEAPLINKEQQQAPPEQKQQAPPEEKQQTSPQQKEQAPPALQRQEQAPPPAQQEQRAPAPPSEKQNAPVQHEGDAPKQPEIKPAEKQAGQPGQPPEAGTPEHAAAGTDTHPPAAKPAANEPAANAKPAQPTPKAKPKKVKIVQPSSADVEAQAKKELSVVTKPKAKPAKKSSGSKASKKSAEGQKTAEKVQGGATQTPAPADQEPQVKQPASPPQEKTDISKQHSYTEHVDEAKGVKYKIAEGELGNPGEVERHRSKYQQGKVAGGTGDDAGHLISDLFGGSGGKENLSLQNWKANEYGTYRQMEIEFTGKLNAGVKISVKVTDTSKIDSSRPYKRVVEWTETAPDGKVTQHKRIFANMHTPESREAQGIKPTVREEQKDNVRRLFPEKDGTPGPDSPLPASPAAAKPERPEIQKADSKFKPGPAANDNVDHPTPPGNEPISAVMPIPEEIPEQQPMKMAANGAIIHQDSPQGMQTKAMAGSQPPGNKPKLTLVKPNEPVAQQTGSKGPSGPGAAGKASAQPAKSPIEAKVDAAVAKVSEKTFQEHLQEAGEAVAKGEKPALSIENQRTNFHKLMSDLQTADPDLYRNFEMAFNSLHNRALWKTVLLRINAEQANIGTKPSSLRRALAQVDTKNLTSDEVRDYVHEHANLSRSSEAAWNLAEEAHGQTPQLVVATQEFNPKAGPPTAPFGNTFYDVNASPMKFHGVTSHMLQDLVITEGFRQAGKPTYTAEKLRGNMFGVGAKAKPGVILKGQDLWETLFDGVDTNKLMNAPENVLPMVRDVFPDIR